MHLSKKILDTSIVSLLQTTFYIKLEAAGHHDRLLHLFKIYLKSNFSTSFLYSEEKSIFSNCYLSLDVI